MILPPPLASCSKMFMLHMNFASRAREHGDWPAHPVYHLKPPSTLTSGDAPVVMPPGVVTMVAEAEIAVVIGRHTKDVSERDALDHVSHLAAANDVTVFDYGWADTPALVRAKGFDSFTPIGGLLPIASIDPTDLLLRLWVNGTLRQEAHSADLIFPFARLVAELSAVMTLHPGDVILTGTPAGAPLLRPGDVVTVDLAGRSTTTNIVIADPRLPCDLLPPARVTPRGRAVSRGAVAHRLSGASASDLARLTAAGLDSVTRIADRLAITLSPIALSGGPATLVGHALTLRQVPDRTGGREAAWPAPARAALGALQAVGPGEVVVAEGRLSDGHVAALESRIAERAAAGLIADATVRGDVRYQPVAINTPVAIGMVTVMPGDIVLRSDGKTVLIPGHDVDRLLDALP